MLHVKTETWRVSSPKEEKKLLSGTNRTIHSGYLHGTSSVKAVVKSGPSGSVLTDPCIIPRIFQNKGREGNMNLIVRERNSLENVLKIFQGSRHQTRFTLTSPVNYGLFPLRSAWWTVQWKQRRAFNREIIIFVWNAKNATCLCQVRC